MKRLPVLVLMIFAVQLLACSGRAFGEPLAAPRHREFHVPNELRSRVDFWIEVFTQRGKNQVVIHHRNFPQAVFSRLDFRHDAERLNTVQLEVFKKRRVQDRIKEINAALNNLARGAQPRNDVEKRAHEVMKLVPGGHAKYREAVREELVRSQTGIREKWAEAIRRSGRYIHLMEDIFVREYGLPAELTRSPFIESSFDYYAYSSAGAAGIWQFMRSTGRNYMTINNLVDERRDVIASTRAAARYLRSAYNSLGNWPLAITSYNHGVVGVARKVRQFGSSNLARIIESPGERVFGFASANFYPEFLAALEVYDNRSRYFPEVREEAPVNPAQLKLSHGVSIGLVQQELGISSEELKTYNQALSDLVWSGRYRIPAGYVLKVPAQYAARLTRPKGDAPALIQEVAPPASSVYGGVTYTVRSGDTLGGIARHYKTSVRRILQLNGLSTSRIRPGQRLLVRESEAKGDSKPAAVKPQGAAKGGIKYKVKTGDSLWSISKKLKVSVDKLKKANRLDRSVIKPGQMLTIP